MERRSASFNVLARPVEVFDYLDDPHRLSSHMGRSSVMMLGSKMEMKLDGNGGRAVGSEIILDGMILGIPLFVREFVTEHERPVRKVWETKGPQRMIVLDSYRMGFEISAGGKESRVRIFIDYELPRCGPGRFLGKALGNFYAKWCIDQMARDCVSHFMKSRE